MSNQTLIDFTTCLLLLAVGHWILRVTWTHRNTLKFQLRLFTIALLIRFAASLAIYEFGFWATLGDADGIGWWFGDTLKGIWVDNHYSLIDVIWAWADAFRYTPTAGVLGQTNHVGYYYLLGTVFFIMGTSSRLIAAAVNCFAGALVVVFAYRTARILFSEWVAVRVGWWTCLFPSMIIWSAQTVKEPVVILLEVVALYCCLRMKRSGYALRHVLVTGCAIALMLPFRFYAAYITMAAFITVLLAPSTGPRKTVRWTAFGLTTFFVTVAVVAAVLAGSEARIDNFDLDFVQKFRQDIAGGAGSGVNFDIDMRTTTGFSAGTLIGAAHLLLAPFPWQLGGGSLRMVMTTPELAYWWWLFFVGIIPGVRYVLRERGPELLPVFLFILGLGLLYSMTFGNVGLVYRQRAQLLPWLFMFAGVGLEQRALRLARRTMRSPYPLPQRIAVPASGRS